jgi:hypothetical protein
MADAQEMGLILVLFGAVGGALLAWGTAAARSAERRAFAVRGERLAHRLGGTFDPGSFSRGPAVHFSAHGRPAVLRWLAEESGSSTVVTVDLRGHSPGILQIHPVGREAPADPLRWAPAFRAGQRDFDSRYLVRSRPETLARHVFSPERRARVVAAVARLYGRPRIDLSRDQLRLTVPAALEVEAELMLLARSANDFAEFILESEPTADILWLDGPLPKGGHCPVCGSDLASQVVYCRRCRTPHHEECWSYVGGCSTYACKEGLFLRGRA